MLIFPFIKDAAFDHLAQVVCIKFPHSTIAVISVQSEIIVGTSIVVQW